MVIFCSSMREVSAHGLVQYGGHDRSDSGNTVLGLQGLQRPVTSSSAGENSPDRDGSIGTAGMSDRLGQCLRQEKEMRR